MLLGDVLAVVSFVALTALALLCAMALSALLFPVRTSRAAKEIESHPWKCALVGLFLGAPIVTVGLVLYQVAHPLVRLLGVFVSLVLVLVAAAGSGGFARLVGDRLRARGGLSEAGGIIGGSVMVIGTSLLPLAGWFLLAPLILVISLGAGFRTLPSKRPVALPQSAEAP